MKLQDFMRVIKFDTHLWIRVRKSRLDFTQGKSFMIFHYDADYYDNGSYNELVKLYDLDIVGISVSDVYNNCIEITILKEE